MNLVKYFSVFVISCFALACFAQKSKIDSTLYYLKPIEVASYRLSKFSSSYKTQSFDSTLLTNYSNKNLADLLSLESLVFVKSYGLGSLATTSLRGSGANHTAVLWNGFNLQSPMNGLLDVALIPLNFLEDVNLQYGGAGALWGSGAVGGSIHLSNSSKFSKGTTYCATASVGSFADRQQSMRFEISKQKFVCSLKLLNHSAINNFSFYNTAKFGKPLQNEKNAELKQQALLQENYFLINSHQKLITRFWYQFSNRNIPPSMTQLVNVANQKDESYRATAEWERTGNRITLASRVAYFDENLRYNDSLIQLDSRSRTKVVIAEMESKFSITKYDFINIGINNTHSEAISKEYLLSPHQNRISLFANYKLQALKSSWNAMVSLRKEFIENSVAPFTFSIGMTGKFLRFFYLQTNVAQHYRIPTFNDFYYQGQGGIGNPKLKPESGWSEDFSVTHQHQLQNILWNLSATVFNRNIDNWILWQPISAMVWSPQNVLKVWSRGVEYKLNCSFKLNKLLFSISGLYNYVLSTNEESSVVNDVSLNKQLIYVPIQNAQGKVNICYKGVSISYIHNYVGYRYTTSDNTAFLKPYSLGGVTLSKKVELSSTYYNLFCTINNIWNENYQVIAYNAMPMINYQLGLTIYFNQKNNQHLKH